MVSQRCKMVVQDKIRLLGSHTSHVEIGFADIQEELTLQQLQELDQLLRVHGLELIDNKKSILVEKIKKAVIEQIHYIEEPLTVNFSTYIESKLKYDYTYLSNLFKEIHGSTLEHYIIRHKIEKVKQLLVYDSLTLTEIADRMGYCSIAHLCVQFKKITNLTPKQFMHSKEKTFHGYDNL